MPKPTCSTLRFIQCFLLLPHNAGVWRNNHLRDPVTTLDEKILLPKISEYNFHFTTVVCINGAGRVQNCHLVLGSKPAAWTNLRFVALGQRNRKTCWDKSGFACLQDELTINGGAKIHAGGVVGGVARRLKVICSAAEASDANGNMRGQGRFGLVMFEVWDELLSIYPKNARNATSFYDLKTEEPHVCEARSLLSMTSTFIEPKLFGSPSLSA